MLGKKLSQNSQASSSKGQRAVKLGLTFPGRRVGKNWENGSSQPDGARAWLSLVNNITDISKSNNTGI